MAHGVGCFAPECAVSPTYQVETLDYDRAPLPVIWEVTPCDLAGVHCRVGARRRAQPLTFSQRGTSRPARAAQTRLSVDRVIAASKTTRGRGVPGTNDARGFLFSTHDGEVSRSGFSPLAAGNVRETSRELICRDSVLFRDPRSPRGGSRARHPGASARSMTPIMAEGARQAVAFTLLRGSAPGRNRWPPTRRPRP